MRVLKEKGTGGAPTLWVDVESYSPRRRVVNSINRHETSTCLSADLTSSMMTDMWIVSTRIGPDDARTGRYCWTALKSSD